MSNLVTLRHLFQIKVSLHEARPPIWRRLLVTDTLSLASFHQVLQVAMGWENYHEHQFIYHHEVIGDLDPFSRFTWATEQKTRLRDLLKYEGDWLTYEYDFGCSWLHDITLEQILTYDLKRAPLYCKAGRRACPPENCGGAWGFEALLDAYTHPQHPDYQDILQLLPDKFDPSHFDRHQVNYRLRQLKLNYL